MFEQTIEYLHFAPDLRPLPLWAALQSSFWIKVEFWVITLSQALTCTWFLLHWVLAPQNGFHKNQKKVCPRDGHERYEVSKFDKNSAFCGFGPWFLDNNKHKKKKFAFSCIIQPIFSENEKRNVSTMLLTHIFAFKVAVSFNESLFALKGPKCEPQYLANKLKF